MVRITLTEKSYRKDFITKLSKILEPHNLFIFDDASISFIDSENNRTRTRFPDIIIADKDKVHQEGDVISIAKDGVIAVIETKKAQKGVYSGVSQALDYMGYLDTKHAFATNFKDVIGFQILEGRPKIDEKLNPVLNETSMSYVIDFIVDVLISKKELQPIELNDDLIVKILEGSVSEILQYMKKTDSEKLEEPLGFFFAKKLDTKIIESPKNRKEFTLAIRKAGAYLIVNQILFYRILSVEENSKYQEIKKIDKISDLQKYFDKVLEDDYRSIFGAKVSSFLTEDSTDALNSIIRAVKVLRLERIKHDILGKIFHGLIPKELRKRIAAYYTSNSAGELLANLCIDDKDAKVIDPACGSGTLLVSCYKRKRELYGEDNKDVHKKLLEQIIGGDISIFAAHLAAIHLALQEPLSYTDEVHIILGDFFSYSPKKTILDWINQSRTMKKVSAESIRDIEFKVPFSDLVIMNPPFTRMELLEKDYKKFVENSFENSDKKAYLQGRMGLHALFLLHSDEFLKSTGRMAAVLPASTFYTGYGEKLEEFFLSKYNIKYIISSDVETAFSEQSTFKEILFIADKKGKESKQNANTLFISLKVPLTLKNSKEIANKIRLLKDSDFEDEAIRVKLVSKNELTKEKNWMIFTDLSSRLYKRIASMNNIVQSKTFLEDKISEGIRRFPTEFFVFPNSFWSIIENNATDIQIEHADTKEKLKISKKLLTSTIRKPELYDTIKIEPSHYLLVINPNEKLDDDLKRYISLGEKIGRDKESSTLVKTTHRERVPWYSYTYILHRNPKIFGNVFVIDKLRVNTGKLMAHYASEKVTAGGSFHILSIDSDEDAKILALWYNSMIHMFLFLFAGREIQGAYYRALISDLKKLPILDVNKIDNKSRQKLLDMFNKYSSIKFPSFPRQIEQGMKKELDLTLLDVLEDKEANRTLKFIYQYLSNKIEKLRVETNK